MPTITEDSILSQVTSDPSGFISVQKLNRVLRDGVVISSIPHRHIVSPGDSLAQEDPKVAAIAAATWTPELMAALTATIVTKANEETAERNAAKTALEQSIAEYNASAALARQAEQEAILAHQAAILAQQAIPVLVAAPTSEAIPTNIVNNVQIRLALSQTGLRDAVENAVSASSQSVKDWYNHSLRFSRTDPMVLAVAQALGVTSAQLDSLWALAKTK